MEKHCTTVTLVDWLFVAKEVGKNLLEPCVLPRENGVFCSLRVHPK